MKKIRRISNLLKTFEVVEFEFHDIPKGSVATHLRGGDILLSLYYKFTSKSVGERILKMVSIWQSKRQKYHDTFWEMV